MMRWLRSLLGLPPAQEEGTDTMAKTAKAKAKNPATARRTKPRPGPKKRVSTGRERAYEEAMAITSTALVPSARPTSSPTVEAEYISPDDAAAADDPFEGEATPHPAPPPPRKPFGEPLYNDSRFQDIAGPSGIPAGTALASMAKTLVGVAAGTVKRRQAGGIASVLARWEMHFHSHRECPLCPTFPNIVAEVREAAWGRSTAERTQALAATLASWSSHFEGHAAACRVCAGDGSGQ